MMPMVIRHHKELQRSKVPDTGSLRDSNVSPGGRWTITSAGPVPAGGSAHAPGVSTTANQPQAEAVATLNRIASTD